MRRKIVVFSIMLLFFGLAITPTINSSLLNIQSTKEGNDDLIEVEVYNFKGKYGYDKTYKKISSTEYSILRQEQEVIDSRELPLEEQIRLKIKLFKEYDLIPKDYSYEEMKKAFDRQKFILRLWSFESLLNYKAIQKSITASSGEQVNIMALIYFDIFDPVGITIGIPPWRIIWPYVLKYIPVPSIWATAFFKGDGYFWVRSVGMLGTEKGNWYNYLYLNGFIGIAVLLGEYDYYDTDLEGFGWTAFCSAVSGEWGVV